MTSSTISASSFQQGNPLSSETTIVNNPIAGALTQKLDRSSASWKPSNLQKYEKIPQDTVDALVRQLAILEGRRAAPSIKRRPRLGDFSGGFANLLRRYPRISESGTPDVPYVPVPAPGPANFPVPAPGPVNIPVTLAPVAADFPVAPAPIAALLAPSDPELSALPVALVDPAAIHAVPAAPAAPAVPAIPNVLAPTYFPAVPHSDSAVNSATSGVLLSGVVPPAPIAVDALGTRGSFGNSGGESELTVHAAPQSSALMLGPPYSLKNDLNQAPMDEAAAKGAEGAEGAEGALVPLQGSEGGRAGGRPGFAPLAWSGAAGFLRFPGIRGFVEGDTSSTALQPLLSRDQMSPAPAPAGVATPPGLNGAADSSSPDRANASIMLESIMRELHDIEVERNAAVGSREGLPCSPEGSWHAMAAGVRLDISCGADGDGSSGRSENDSGSNSNCGVRGSKERGKRLGSIGTWCADCGDGSLEVRLALPVPPCDNALLSLEWRLRGLAPFSRSGLFTLTGLDPSTRRTLTFSGQCRVCGGADTITGQWMISQEPRDCRDTHMFLKEYRDVFRRETLHVLRQKRLRELKAIQETSTDTQGPCNFYHSYNDTSWGDIKLNPNTNAERSIASMSPEDAVNVLYNTSPNIFKTSPPDNNLFGKSQTIKPTASEVNTLKSTKIKHFWI